MTDEIGDLKARLIQTIFNMKYLSTNLHSNEDVKKKYGISIAELEIIKAVKDNSFDADKNVRISDI